MTTDERFQRLALLINAAMEHVPPQTLNVIAPEIQEHINQIRSMITAQNAGA